MMIHMQKNEALVMEISQVKAVRPPAVSMYQYILFRIMGL